MKISILSIGDELLRGSTVNTNLARIGQELGAVAIFPVMEMAVKDSRNEILDGLDILFKRSDLVISTGGLGPTSDDVTKTVVAEYFGLKLKEDAKIADRIRSFWSARRLGKMPESVLNQALVPEGAKVIENKTGTAPGLIIEGKKLNQEVDLISKQRTRPARPSIFIPSAKNLGMEGHARHDHLLSSEIATIIMLPGPPHEMYPMLMDSVIPYLRSSSKDKLYTEIIYVSGIPESCVEEKAAPTASSAPSLSIAYCASPESIKIFLSGRDKSLVARKMNLIRKELGEFLLSGGAKTIAEEIIFLLGRRKIKLGVAESCTGGMIASAITDIPGSSDVLMGSAVTYSNDWKMKILGVRQATLKKFGAVSDQCAKEMVEGVCKKFKTEAGISVTGIAGPGGGTAQKPVGLVFIATRYAGKTIVEQYKFPGTREMVRRRAVSSALNQLRRQMLSLKG